MNNTEKIKLLIADSQYLTNVALEKLLGQKYTVESVVFSGIEIKKYLDRQNISLMIIDPFQFDYDDFINISNITKVYPSLKILVLTNSVSQVEFNELNSAGIHNILLKTTGEEELNQAIEATLKGKKFYSQEILELLLEQSPRKEKANESHNLTHAEIEIVKLIAQGFTTKEIASRKFISFHTVMTHRKNIFRKLQVTSVSELIMHAIKAGWIDNIEYYI